MAAVEQARVFWAMALCGALCAALYDALRHAANAAGGPALAGAADLLFGPLCAAGMTATALATMTDPFRGYEVAGVAVGIALYALSIGTFVRVAYKIMKKFGKKS